MPRTNIRALRFAEAAFAVARDTNQLDAWLSTLERASEVFENQAASLFLTSPVEPAEKKLAVLDQLLPGASTPVRNFFGILARREQLGLLPEIATAFHRLLNEYNNVAVAEVTTAVPIDERQKAQIAAKLGSRLGKTVVLETRVDPEILGGVIAQVGDNVIDGSVRGRLDRLSRSLTV